MISTNLNIQDTKIENMGMSHGSAPHHPRLSMVKHLIIALYIDIRYVAQNKGSKKWIQRMIVDWKLKITKG